MVGIKMKSIKKIRNNAIGSILIGVGKWNRAINNLIICIIKRTTI